MSGLLGIGGAIFIIPGLVYLLGFDQKLAQGTTLMLMLPPIGILAFLEYYRKGLVNLPVGIVIAFCFVIGAFLGAKLAIGMDTYILKRFFAVFLVFVALSLWFS
ncbi:sulfite exporter TauE/SafE family protein [Thermospira aquatica]|nr:sulfite exporter TauE/SafE family protein [Thermospira aquatica]